MSWRGQCSKFAGQLVQSRAVLQVPWDAPCQVSSCDGLYSIFVINPVILYSFRYCASMREECFESKPEHLCVAWLIIFLISKVRGAGVGRISTSAKRLFMQNEYSKPFVFISMTIWGGICHCRQQCKFFVSGVNFSIFTHFFVFLSLKLLKLGEIDGVKFLAWKSGGVKFLTNPMSASLLHSWHWVLIKLLTIWYPWKLLRCFLL